MSISMCIDCPIVADHDHVEPHIPDNRPKPGDMQMVKRQQRVGRHEQMDQGTGEIKQVLDWMHRQAGPGARIYAVVVHRMDPSVKHRHMDQAVNAVEVEFVNDWDDEAEADEPGRIIAKGRPWSPAI